MCLLALPENKLLIYWQIFEGLRLLEKGNLTIFPSIDREESFVLVTPLIIIALFSFAQWGYLLNNDGYPPTFTVSIHTN